ncbi:hypothetical protein FBY06_11959 [Pseudomonas sp. SJZ085]|nr:hypothetical protein FBX99_11956 [Pseudomonas sp. SJZ074]TWC17941.1 hypothetical protein FBY00_10855 [Pseudomonas sp. SJZ075]TWC34217.1 hypothetical protein FBY02_10755 [Pseudomonas sp. SJZ078]TWC34900.1 hypothetical protein FBY06_11959 [Pseudomonas sp. SJZ085]TWC55106.1 hypothetical protein FBY11_10855 [Pseudomonas sp. SJZ124]TWC90609.1 hypothetical protein FBY09_10855 [Pseudomonas sp. SJZ101]
MIFIHIAFVFGKIAPLMAKRKYADLKLAGICRVNQALKNQITLVRTITAQAQCRERQSTKGSSPSKLILSCCATRVTKLLPAANFAAQS